MRDIVKLCLGADRLFILTSCTNGEDALAIAIDRAPDVILSDVTMSMLDGSALLVRLRNTATTSKIPVLLLATRSDPREIERLKSLGANDVITKPFDPATFNDTIRNHIRSFKIEVAGYNFDMRLRADAVLLAAFRKQMSDDLDLTVITARLLECAHKLAGAAGVFNYRVVSSKASALEDSIIERHAGRGTQRVVETNLDALLECMARE